MRVTLLPMLLLCATPVRAQGAAEAHYLSATEIRDAVSSAARDPARMAAKPLGDRGSYTYIAIRRDQTGEAEVHAVWDDVIVVQQGVGTLLYGGRVAGDRETGPGERRGGQIAGGTTRTLAAGDLVVVPAGMPHQLRVEPGGSITYLGVKVARTSAPKRPGE